MADVEALRVARTLVYYEACLDHEVPHAAARELWAHDMTLPFRAGEHVTESMARLLEVQAQQEAAE
ncbi:hypothetical protein ABIA32_003102 [Streptacidiphilus sp. MAP12-20]|uniref:hypothetical protein n=1 Tax=Streptacidiphilus sp. MAP12-20 TaxID=3156299 RepID=UPI0035197D85